MTINANEIIQNVRKSLREMQDMKAGMNKAFYKAIGNIGIREYADEFRSQYENWKSRYGHLANQLIYFDIDDVEDIMLIDQANDVENMLTKFRRMIGEHYWNVLMAA